MADESIQEQNVEETDAPTQTVRRMPEDQPDVGPYFPSGMSAPEAAAAGATANMTEDQVATLRGEKVEARTSDEDE